MKVISTIQTAALLTLALVLSASAQGPRGGGGPQGQGGSRGEPGGMGPPDPAVLAVDLVTDFDVDGDSALAETELQAALDSLPVPPDVELAAATEWLATYDVDETGNLEADELAIALEENKPEPPQGGPRDQR